MDVKQYLEEGEQVVAEARQSRFRAGGRPFFPETVVATDRRLIIIQPLPFGRADVFFVWYRSISAVRLKRGLFSCAVEFEAMGVSHVAEAKKEWGEAGVAEITGIPCDVARKIIEVIQKASS